MNLYRSFLISILFLTCMNSFAQNSKNDVYMVEVIIFENLEMIGDEELQPKNLNLGNIDSIHLVDKTKISVNKKSIKKSFDHAGKDFLVEMLAIDPMKEKQNDDTEIASLFNNLDESNWYKKQENLNQLNGIYRRIDRRKEYKILHRQAWLQPALDKEKSPHIHEIFNNNGLLVKLYQSRYLHLDVIAYLDGNLKTDSNTELIKEIKLDALKNSIPNDVINYDIKIPSETFELNEIIQTDLEIHETENDSLIRLNEVRFIMREERRIFKNEVHYFDHPKIGVIISVYDSSL
mgnify:FL=1